MSVLRNPLNLHCGLICFSLSMLLSSFVWSEKAPDSVNALIPKLEAWGKNAALIEAVKSHNSKKMSLDEIKAKDAAWRKVTGVDAFMKEIMSNDAAKTLEGLEKASPFLFECFLMGNQGANIAMTNKTSDYWQGDEAKFTESFHGGKGKVFVGDVEFDDSADAYLVQISVPVMDGDTAIGAITIGVNLDEYEASLQ